MNRRAKRIRQRDRQPIRLAVTVAASKLLGIRNVCTAATTATSANMCMGEHYPAKTAAWYRELCWGPDVSYTPGGFDWGNPVVPRAAGAQRHMVLLKHAQGRLGEVVERDAMASQEDLTIFVGAQKIGQRHE